MSVSLLDIRVPDTPATGPCVTSLLRAAARLSPDHLVLTLPSGVVNLYRLAELTCLEHTTKIDLSALSLSLRAPPVAGKCPFPVLTTLILSGVTMYGLTAVVPCCPCLRVLRFARAEWDWSLGERQITVHSESLRQLVVEDGKPSMRRIDIVTPALEQLTMSTFCGRDLSVSVLAPKAEKISWHCAYWHVGFRVWDVESLSLTTAAVAETRRPTLLRIDALKKNVYYGGTDHYLAQEVEKHLQMQVDADLSVLDIELYLKTLDHIYGAIIVYLFSIHRVRTAARSLKVVIVDTNGAWECCHDDCLCQTTDWKNQSISLTNLEELEVDGFKGYEHEFEFLELVFRCAPMLKRVTVKQSPEEDDPSDAEIYDMFKAHPWVECYLDPL